MSNKPNERSKKIAALNDRLRTTFNPLAGRVIMTRGLSSMKAADRRAVFSLVMTFNQFTPDNDPHNEHDFGSVEYGDERFFFKFDYYDKTMQYLSPDPANPELTNRVMTIMRAREY
jgi:hypothetical protein